WAGVRVETGVCGGPSVGAKHSPEGLQAREIRCECFAPTTIRVNQARFRGRISVFRQEDGLSSGK
ncbi:MAG TPA: hypothetical protein VFJ58_22560, partial [Armatimonadota bacterium]|nr:hypothetical protein [Armatimonadota bacterium]